VLGRALGRLDRVLRGIPLRRATAGLGAAALACGCAACARSAPSPPPASRPPATPSPPVALVDGGGARPTSWPAQLAAALAGHGAPHGEALALPRDAAGRERWLAFVGTDEVAIGAWQVSLAPDGSGSPPAQIEPAARWPTGVRVVGGTVQRGVAYVLVESLAVLDQPGGLRGVWTGSADHPSAFDASPLALAGVADVAEVAARVNSLPAPTQSGPASLEHGATTLLTTLRAASGSAQTLARALAPEGADVEIAWQSLFARGVSHLDPDGPLAPEASERALALVRDVLGTQACGLDACEAWTDRGRAVVRFASQGGRWGIRTLVEDAAPAPTTTGQSAPREVDGSTSTEATRSLLVERVKEVRQILGEAPLSASGGTIGVALTDAAPDVPCVVVREGLAARMFVLDVGPIRAQVEQGSWESTFADVDGDGRTDVVLRMSGSRADGASLVWTEVFLAPPPSVQVSSLEADLPSALAAMDAPDAHAAARAAARPSPRAVSREEACQVLAAATTPAGFRHNATPGARLLQFQEPARPTWRPKVVSVAKISAGDVHGLSAHCAELTCDKTRPYCSYAVPGDSLHVWFAWNAGRLEIDGVADYSGE
jgi:hypothetical protein